MAIRYVLAVVCVLGIAAGQILFKLSANAMREAGLMSLKSLGPLVAAFALYGVTSLGWVWVLKELPLNRVYPFMAAAFIVVPVASYFIFDDRLNFQYAMGSVLIVIGVLITVNATQGVG